MIEPTDEMVAAFWLAHATAIEDDGFHTKDDAAIRLNAALAALLAVVERDYEPIRCDNRSWTGRRCTKPRGHENGHLCRFSGTVWP